MGLLGVIGIPIGKAMTGLTAGLLSRFIVNGEPTSKKAFGVVFLSYVPECLFTVAFFIFLVPLFLRPEVASSVLPFLPVILIKAWIEIGLIATLMGALVGNRGFADFIKRFFGRSSP